MTDRKPPEHSRTKMYVGWGIILAVTLGIVALAAQ